jgi:hypothetical protein
MVGGMFLLRVAVAVAVIPALVILDWAVYNYVGAVPGHVVTVLSVVGGTAALWYLAQVDEDEADPLGADRRRH